MVVESSIPRRYVFPTLSLPLILLWFQAKMIADSVADDKNMKFKGVSDLGRLDAFCNLLKFDGFRAVVWNIRKVQKCIMNAISGVESADPLVLYRGVFCIWCVSFNKELVSSSVADMGDDIVQVSQSWFVIAP